MNVYDRLDILRKEIEATKKKLKIRRAIVEDNRARAMQGKDSFHDAKLELWKVESNIVVFKKEMGEVKNKKEVVYIQIQEMEKGGGVSFWPIKPFLHPNARPLYLEVDAIILVTFGSFCKKGFNFFDVAMGSCKHVYHPFHWLRL
jgi:hypothetical protein